MKTLACILFFLFLGCVPLERDVKDGPADRSGFGGLRGINVSIVGVDGGDTGSQQP